MLGFRRKRTNLQEKYDYPMYWRGCRHPLALNTAQLHPPTALVRWLSRFTVQQQVDHGRQILQALAAEEARVHDLAFQLVPRMLPQRGAASRWIALLPDLLRAVEPSQRAVVTCLLPLDYDRRMSQTVLTRAAEGQVGLQS